MITKKNYRRPPKGGWDGAVNHIFTLFSSIFTQSRIIQKKGKKPIHEKKKVDAEIDFSQCSHSDERSYATKRLDSQV